MPRQIALLRGINLGAHKRVAMPALRQLLSDAGFEDVKTYVQSGNVVLNSDSAPERVARDCERHILDGLGLEVDVVVRTRDELAEVVARNPLGDIVDNPKRYQVSFLESHPDPQVFSELAALAAPPERCVLIEREIYAWHPDGVGRSKLSAKLASAGGLGVKSTARNWTTVTALLEMAHS